MKYLLLPHIKPEIARRIRGTTDSEWMYATLMSQVEDPTADLSSLEIARAVERMPPAGGVTAAPPADKAASSPSTASGSTNVIASSVSPSGAHPA